MPDLTLTTLGGDQVAVPAAEIEALATRMRGTLLRPSDDGYEAARAIWNGMHDTRPGLIARCQGAADVQDAVRFAAERGLLVSVRGGGHNVAGTALCDGGLVIDLSPMRGVRVDAKALVADAEAGCTWGDLDRETQAFGLLTPGGNISTTGIAGLTLGGGMGMLRRRFGMSCDNLVSAEVVTADGRLLRASADENDDLFWALRGGGGNFGVVTSFRYRLHALGPQVYAAAVMYPAEEATAVVRGWRDFCASAPDEAGPYVFGLTLPDSPPFPEAARGRVVMVVLSAWAGDLDEGEKAQRPLRELGQPLVDMSGPWVYTELQKSFDWFFPHGNLYYWKTTTLRALDDAAIDTYLSVAIDRPSPGTGVGLWQLGGAIARVGATETAYGRRDAPFLVNIDSGWSDPAENERQVQWTRDAHRTLSALSDGGLYVGYGSREDLETVKAAYGENFSRLVAIKRKYDPDNLFRRNQNIPPDAG